VTDISPAIPVLSDLDGTLIDSKASVVGAFRWWAELRGLDPTVADRIPFGRTSTDAAAVLAPQLDATAEGALLDARQQADTSGVKALAGARELLGRHRRIAVVTSCPRGLAEARLQAAGLPIPHILLTPECWTRGKPDPEPYLLGARALGADPAECIVLEDAPSGVESGLAAGTRVIAVLSSHARESLPGATAYVTSLVELSATIALLGTRASDAVNDGHQASTGD
jgi:sugar-phosphatase